MSKANDEIDWLFEAEYIKTPQIYNIFREVPRENYTFFGEKPDLPFVKGNLFMYPTCVYAEVMEELELRPGLSFLNLGSGSGYLSTLAGLILGTYGFNHGIELFSNIIELANEKLEDFISTCSGLHKYDFCEPSFIQGNCFLIDSSCQQYDRVFCGSSCPAEYELYMKNLVKVGGILIMPLREKFWKIIRTGESSWHVVRMSSRSYVYLIEPALYPDSSEHINLATICPPKLKYICRSIIRQTLRSNIDIENPSLKNKRRGVEGNLWSHGSSESQNDYFTPGLSISSPSTSKVSDYHEALHFKNSELKVLKKAVGMKTETNTDKSIIEYEIDNVEEKENPSVKIDFKKAEFTVTKKQEHSLIASEESSRSDNQTAFPKFKKICNHLHTPSDSPEPDENRRETFSVQHINFYAELFWKKRVFLQKNPDYEGASSSLPEILAERRASPLASERKNTVYTDSGKHVESSNNCGKTNDDEDDVDIYTKHMVKRIAALPLPNSLLIYLKYGRINM